MAKYDDWAPHIRGLLYPIIFEADPLQGLDRVMKVVIEKHALGVSPETYLASVRMALGSNSRLCELIPGNHSEETIRRFLAEVERRLAIMVHKPA